jgi:hypothetical protein
MPRDRAPKWPEALPIVFAGGAVVLYALSHGARAWVVALGIVLNVPLAVIAFLILLPG